jgi:membrane protease YdiL (CAAX protease family)
MKQKAYNIFAAFGVMVVWTMFITSFMKELAGSQLFYKQPTPLYMFVTACIIAPLTEEGIFRWAPLTLLKPHPHLMWPVIVIVSALFGYLHGGFSNIIIQGVFGVVFSWVYINNGYSYWSSVVLHSLWNITVLFFISFK